MADNSIWGYIKFEKNFTDMIHVKFDDPMGMTPEDIDASMIQGSLDMSSNFTIVNI